MPHFPKPFWREDRQRWMLQLRSGKVITLGPDRKTAFERYHEIMAEQAQAPPAKTATVTSTANEPTVAEILDQFLDWVLKNRKRRTFETYQERLQQFLAALENPELTVAKLKPYHVTRFVDKYPKWSATMRRGRMMAVQTAMNWAVKEGLIERSPISKLHKPASGHRDNPVTLADHEAILAANRSEEFRDLLILAWETGARPQELRRAEARHYDRTLSALLFPPEEAKGNRWRAVYLTDTARAIIERLVQRHPKGVLFRNEDGRPWTVSATSCAFRRIKEKIGRKFCLYDYRHGWATSALERGIDPVSVSVLLGHADSSMLCRVYQHLARNTDNMRTVMGKVRAKTEDASASPDGEAAKESPNGLRPSGDGDTPPSPPVG